MASSKPAQSRWSSRAFPAEARGVALIAAAQFICSLDFIIALPLGPELARGLGASMSHVGYMTSAYATAAFVFGLGSAGILDRFDRRPALVTTLLGLVCASSLSAAANSMATLLTARFLAGAFAGPGMALGLAMISDLVPPERRGRAVTVIITAGSLASIMGVPAGLTLAQLGGWRAPFGSIALVGLAICALIRWGLPSMGGHLHGSSRETVASRLLAAASPIGALAIVCSMISAASGYIIVANVPAHLQVNLDIPASAFGGFYLAGGCTAFVVTRLSGRLLDRLGSWPVMLLANLVFTTVVWELFIDDAAFAPVIVLFIGSMTANALRNASLQTALTRVPAPSRRAAFLSVTGSVQHLGTALGSAGASLLLHDTGHTVLGMDKVGWLAIALTVTLTPLVMAIDAWTRRPRVAA